MGKRGKKRGSHWREKDEIMFILGVDTLSSCEVEQLESEIGMFGLFGLLKLGNFRAKVKVLWLYWLGSKS